MKTQAESRKRVDSMMEQLKNKEIRKDVLKNDAFPFEEEMSAMYYSNCRRFMKTQNAHQIMEHRI